MRQLVYQVCYTRYQVSFYLSWIGSLLKYCKVPKYYDQDCRIYFKRYYYRFIICLKLLFVDLTRTLVLLHISQYRKYFLLSQYELSLNILFPLLSSIQPSALPMMMYTVLRYLGSHNRCSKLEYFSLILIYFDVIWIKIFYAYYVIEKVARTNFRINFFWTTNPYTNMIISLELLIYTS